jgi:segregation and condensation protein B
VYGWEISTEEIKTQLDELKVKYSTEEFAFELVEIADGYRFLTKTQYYPVVSVFLEIKAKKRLTTAALETLSIIAYRQPISKPEIEKIRGVNTDYSIQKLLEKDLIVIDGKGTGPGKPILYTVSKTFMDHFGLKSMEDLPKLKDLKADESQIGLSLTEEHPAEENVNETSPEINLEEPRL